MDVQLHITSAYDLIEQVAPVENDADGPFRKKPKSTTGLWTSSWREETHVSAGENPSRFRCVLTQWLGKFSTLEKRYQGRYASP